MHAIGLAAGGLRSTHHVEIHTLDSDRKPSVEEFRKQCRRHVRGIPGEPASIRICRWLIRDDAPHDFHDRYVLTDRGGYNLGKGLDQETGKEQPIRLLDHDEWKRLRDGYRDASPFFTKRDEFSVP